MRQMSTGDMIQRIDRAERRYAEVAIQLKINGQDTPMTLIKQGENWRIEKFEFPII